MAFLVAAAVVLHVGVVSYRKLAIDEYPDVTYPIVVAQTAYPGASPEVVERDRGLDDGPLLVAGQEHRRAEVPFGEAANEAQAVAVLEAQTRDDDLGRRLRAAE